MAVARRVPFLMVTTAIRVAVVLAAVAVVTGYGSQSSPPGRPWPPGVQKVSAESPVLPPADALQTFHMPPGYRVELVASEPLIQEPVAIDWDTSGRLWAVEMPGFMADLTGSNELDPIGRVVVLEDADGDGRMDRRTVFADKLVLARSLKILDRGVLVAEPPNVWLMRDTDGDLRADTKELVTNQYGRREADPQNNANGFLWGLDNRLYTAGQSDVQFRLKSGAFEVEKTLQRGEWGVTQDDAGRTYRNTNESPLHVDLVPTAYFARNPNLLRTRGSYERLADENDELLTVWPVRPSPGTNRAYQTGIDRADGSLARFTSVCAPVVYRGDRLPADLYGNVFVAEPAGNLVSRIVVTDGDRVRARKAYDAGEFLASTDERFRPVYVSNAPDGTLYVVDMYRGIIEHRISVTEYLRDQILARKLDRPTGLGRIYRVVHETTRRDTSAMPAKWTAEQLVGELSHPNGWRRDTAQRLLVERHETSATPALAKLAERAEDWRTRLRALWTLDGLDAIDPATVTRALEDASPDVRASAVRMAERWLAAPDHPILAATLQRLDDADARVRRQLAASLGTLPAGARETAVATLLDRHGEDAVTLDAALSGVRGGEPAVLDKMIAGGGSQTSPRETAIAMLAATIVRGGQESAAQRVLATIADDSLASWQRSALLRGAEVALTGASMPGTPEPRRGSQRASTGPPLPCPTCPGGRAGPGGAYAFGGPPSAGRPASPPRGLRLNREPLELSRLANGEGDVASRIARVIARVEWPGKPGAAAPVAPLGPEDQQRFAAGQEVYRNICQACHQPDGRGQDRVAPSLVGSEWAMASPDITARILLNGKEGSIGLMPPVGQAFTDDQIAAVLTYIRREWGQTGSPVDPETVKKVRALTTGRTRAWTTEELRALTDTRR